MYGISDTRFFDSGGNTPSHPTGHRSGRISRIHSIRRSVPNSHCHRLAGTATIGYTRFVHRQIHLDFALLYTCNAPIVKPQARLFSRFDGAVVFIGNELLDSIGMEDFSNLLVRRVVLVLSPDSQDHDGQRFVFRFQEDAREFDT